ncbi:MAG TPA: excinuclease ABC subunit UvrC, partial [Proteobacteria bacterium]|nr:excinuclease ABC subunit UvrC [Pseudomonadota bacterium]
KAGNIRSRVLNYFRRSGDNRPRIPSLMARVADLDYLVTDTEKEALILENHLIKEYRPKYNVDLRDDKTYCHLRIDLSQEYPRPVFVRRPRDDGALYFGPYTSSSSARSTLRWLRKIFPFRSCSDNLFRHRSRPCLYHQVGSCPAPCLGRVSPEEYRKILDDLILFLRGRKRPLLTALRRRMKDESAKLEYEKAALSLDRIRAIEETLEHQKVSRLGEKDRDIIAYETRERMTVFQVLSMRAGRMGEGRTVSFNHLFPDDGEALSSFLVQYYSDEFLIPGEIFLPFLPAHSGAVRELLAERKGKRVSLAVPVRGVKKQLLLLARKNARAVLRQKLSGPLPEEVLRQLRDRLKLRRVPRRIECFDISNLGGSSAVGSMAVFQGGKKSARDYRRYRIKTVEGPDDYGMIFEVLSRRCRRALEDGVFPELIVVDGGKGQLNAAIRVLEDLGIDYPDIIALAKEKRLQTGRVVRDRVFLPGRKNPVLFRRGSPVLHLLMRIRDEAHRFAVTYHKKLRRKESFTSPLDRIPGIGPVLKSRLLAKFQNLEAIRDASLEGLTEVKGLNRGLAKRIASSLNSPGG